MRRKSLLIVYHSQTGGTHALARAALAGAQAPEIAPSVVTTLAHAQRVSPAWLANADGLIVATPENFGAMSGLVKDFFDRCFYPCESAMTGKPYALIVCAGNDGTGAMAGMERIITGWRMTPAHPGLIARRIGGAAGSSRGELSHADFAHARELGSTLAAGLDAGLY